MDKRPLDEQVKSGFVVAGKTLLVIFTGGALAGGIAVLRSPEATIPGSTIARHPFIPWACVIVATLILVPTVKRWATILPGILGYATLGGWIMLFSGHYGKIQVPRPIALALTVFAIATSALTSSFTRREMTLIDRAALLGFVYCLAFSMSSSIATMCVALGIGLTLLLLAWAVDKLPSSNVRAIIHHRREIAACALNAHDQILNVRFAYRFLYRRLRTAFLVRTP